MEQFDHINYERIATAIQYLKTHFKAQPKLDEVAKSVHLSPYHFQRLFTEWAGTTPKRFLQYISIEYAKEILQTKQSTLLETTHQTGLSSTGRLHDLFLKIEGMTPATYKNGGTTLNINYRFAESPFGLLLVASTDRGICHLAFVDEAATAFSTLQQRFPNATYTQQADALQDRALAFFEQDNTKIETLKLHLKGTAFQLKVWEALLKIPFGQLATYGHISYHIGNPNANRAVGTAVGANPVAFLIPCHRIIKSSGVIGNYRWGTVRKTAMIGWEAATVNE